MDDSERTGERMRYFLLVILITLFPNFSLSDEVTAEAQRLLNELGYNAGPVDGLIGGKTRNAMSDAFKSVGKEWDRELDETDLAILKDILKQKTNGEPKTLTAAKTISASDLGLPINYGENHEPYVDFSGFEDDLINLSKITCIYSTGKKAKKCTTMLSPAFNFPKHGLKMQTENVRSGKVALKFINGQNDCGWHFSTSDCTSDGKNQAIANDQKFQSGLGRQVPNGSSSVCSFQKKVRSIHQYKLPYGKSICEQHHQHLWFATILKDIYFGQICRITPSWVGIILK